MRKLRKGIHWVRLNGVKRKVKVLKSGRWQFLKSTKGRKGARCPRCHRKW